MLDNNPLPITCTVTLKKEFQNTKAIGQISNQIQQIKYVDEIVYQGDLLVLIDQYINLVYLIAGGVGFVLSLIAFILLYNTIRLTIFARSDIIEIMKLVGATSAFIRRPFVVEGFMQGLLGAILANGLLYISIQLISKFIYPYINHQLEPYIVMTVFGVIIGLLSSRLSVSRYLLWKDEIDSSFPFIQSSIIAIIYIHIKSALYLTLKGLIIYIGSSIFKIEFLVQEYLNSDRYGIYKLIIGLHFANKLFLVYWNV